MNRFLPAACWALAMVLLATGARLDWVERDAALTLLLVMPLLAFTALGRGACCRLAPRDA